MVTNLKMTIDLQYLPSLEYFCNILKNDKVIIEAHEYFEKQSYRNRCRIQTTNKIDTLTVPVQNGNKKVLIRYLPQAEESETQSKKSGQMGYLVPFYCRSVQLQS